MSKTDNGLHWFVAFVRSCCERKAGDFFESLGYEAFVPIRKEVHKWSDRRKVIDAVLLPHLVFVRMSEDQRRKACSFNPYVTGFMSANRPGSGLLFSPAIVRDDDMELFRCFVDAHSCRIEMHSGKLGPGDRVRVVSGPLEGRECELVSIDGKKCLVSRLGLLGSALVEISADMVRKI